MNAPISKLMYGIVILSVLGVALLLALLPFTLTTMLHVCNAAKIGMFAYVLGHLASSKGDGRLSRLRVAIYLVVLIGLSVATTFIDTAIHHPQ